MKKLLFIAGLFVLLLSACQPAATPTTTNPSQNQGNQAQQSGSNSAKQPGYPAENQTNSGANNANPIYPYVAPAQYFSAYPVVDSPNKGAFTADKIELHPDTSAAGHTDVFVTGSKPSSCSQLQVAYTPPDSSKKINITVYTIPSTTDTCPQEKTPFSGTVISLGGYTPGTYTVIVNGKTAGDITVK